jgi:hypothetical protein
MTKKSVLFAFTMAVVGMAALAYGFSGAGSGFLGSSADGLNQALTESCSGGGCPICLPSATASQDCCDQSCPECPLNAQEVSPTACSNCPLAGASKAKLNAEGD